MKPISGPIEVIKIDFNDLLNKVINEKFNGYDKDVNFEINDDLSDALNVTHYMKRLFIVIYKEYVNTVKRDKLLEIYYRHLEQFIIRYKLDEIHNVRDMYSAAKIIFYKTIEDCNIIQNNKLNQDPYENKWIDIKNASFENTKNEIKKLKQIR